MPTESVGASLLTVPDVSEMLNVPETWVRRAVRLDLIPYLHVGAYVRFDRAELDAWLAEQRRS